MNNSSHVGIAFGVWMVAISAQVQANPSDQLVQEFKNTYAHIAFANYQDAANQVAELEKRIADLVDAASETNLDLARNAWLESRIAYGQSEVFRFADGPIDGVNTKGEEGPEGLINAWPLNEAYIDYVKDNPKAGIIQDLSVNIEKEELINKNQQHDEADVSTGYHAIEFLLWGQDFNPNGPGNRPFTDYVKNSPVNERQGEYLKKTTSLLLKNLSTVVSAWVMGDENYRKEFLALNNKEVLTRVLTSLATLSGFELASERIATALDSGDPEDEHSCFSDNTHVDFIMMLKELRIFILVDMDRIKA